MYKIYCKLRDERNLKDADVVKATGITKSTFSDWKSGRREPKIAKLAILAKYFNVSVDYFVNWWKKLKTLLMKEKERRKTKVEKRPKYKRGESMKKNVIVITGHELTPEERKNYSKDHPGSRLCFRLRFPNFPLYVQSIVLVIEIILIIQKCMAV